MIDILLGAIAFVLFYCWMRAIVECDHLRVELRHSREDLEELQSAYDKVLTRIGDMAAKKDPPA